MIDNRPWLKDAYDVCQRCALPGGEWHRMNCAYIDEQQNWAWLCQDCYDEVTKMYDEMWQEYYNSVIPGLW